jgi:peptidoglycan/LPS O-acetylase OafA/YrhL
VAAAVIWTAPTRSVDRATHLVGLDGIRAVAALSVVFTHVGSGLVTPRSGGEISTLASYGGQGLTLFFVFSGFLLPPFVAAVLNNRTSPSLRRYFTNRGLRIFPAYIVIFLVVLAAGSLSVHGTPGLHQPQRDIGRISSPRIIIPNLFLVQSYIPSSFGTGIGPAWSLTAELTFYACLPSLP